MPLPRRGELRRRRARGRDPARRSARRVGAGFDAPVRQAGLRDARWDRGRERRPRLRLDRGAGRAAPRESADDRGAGTRLRVLAPVLEQLRGPATRLAPAEEWEAVRPVEPRFDAWFKYLPTARFNDPFVEAGRVLLLADIVGWPAASRAVPPADDGRFIAPNLDMAVVFHQPLDASDYLLLQSEAALASGGFIGGNGKVWSEDGRMLASTAQQMMCRPGPTATG
ncbi:MAG: hypothetical protein ACRDWD_15300 [Acidimicrobiia bacterium]